VALGAGMAIAGPPFATRAEPKPARLGALLNNPNAMVWQSEAIVSGVRAAGHPRDCAPAHDPHPRRQGDRMRRRGFLAALGAATSPLAAHAQPAARIYRVGFVFPNAPLADLAGPNPANRYAAAFVQALRGLGYLEGQNLILERRSISLKRSTPNPQLSTYAPAD
jgi:hypothetical protein